MNPEKVTDNGNLKPFDEDSDLDLAIVSNRYFEEAWRSLREQDQPSLKPIGKNAEKALGHQRKRLFDGAILTNKILHLLPFHKQWTLGLVKVSQTGSVLLNRELEVNPWIFRDYWSLRNYVSKGIVGCQSKAV